jgi:hypothetical protein
VGRTLAVDAGFGLLLLLLLAYLALFGNAKALRLIEDPVSSSELKTSPANVADKHLAALRRAAKAARPRLFPATHAGAAA